MVVDHPHFKSLKDILGRDKLVKVARSYEQDSQAKLIALEQAVQADDLDDVTHLSHSLKSASSNLALVSLASLFAQMEANASQGQTDALGELLQAAKAEYPAALRTLHELL
ncbi:Hpt domain protein [Marinomonas aquimarina]|uniref:Hpt domain protein n=1 Tax=Marinomonas aquimarina TaxID=295068 RepID=A0A1A8TF17_9GAMM|nr:Hpt domain-containing protein [Marinomonas aquimarina]SBS31053.1 Hpt domain protein [Marinomonas aquimarina]